MKTRRIHLIRHGQTNWNRDKRVQGHSESELTELGQRQAASLSRALSSAGVPISKVYCSSSHRTRQTADIVFSHSSPEIEYCDRLKEIYLGPWEGKYQAEVRESHAEQFEYFWNRPHLFQLGDGAETFEEVQKRGMSRFLELSETDGDGEVAIVSHGVLIKTILCAIEPRPLSALWEPPTMLNCCHSIIEITDDGSKIVQYAHVAPDHES